MSVPPPALTPQQKALQRVTSLSRLNGWSVVVVAGLGGLVSLLLGDWLSTGIGAMAAGFGWLEVRGHRMLRRRNPEGMKWLVRSQVLLLALILAYCASRLGSFDSDTAMGNLTPDMEAMLKEAGLDRRDIVPLVRSMFLALYGTVALVAVIYQGGLALFYRGKTPLVTAALTAPPEPPSQSVY